MPAHSNRHDATLTTALLLILSSTRLTLAQNFTASTCVSPSGFTQCYNQAATFYQSCFLKAGSNLDAVQACICVLQLDELNCAMSNCWNVVYGCEYQTLANDYITACASPVPFFPAPDNAPGGCSCNLGYVTYNASAAALEYKDCITSDVDRNDGCSCCYEATGYAALYGICPTTNPDLTSLAGPDASDLFDVVSPDLKIGECSSALAKYDCKSLGYTGLGVPFMTSVDSATFGTQTLSNTNTRTLTSPVSGATFTWTDLGIAYTIVAASANANRGGGSSSSSSKAGSSTAATTTGSMSSNSAGASSTSGSSASGASQSQSTMSAKSSAETLRSLDWTVGCLVWLSLCLV